MNRFRPIYLLFALSLTACAPAATTDPGPAPVVLRSYAVGGQGGQAVSVLSQAFRADPPQARFVKGPGGEVIVVATEDIQQGVKQFLDQLGNLPSAAPVNIALNYYVLEGQPGEGSRPNVPALFPAMDAIVARSGPTDFALIDTAALVSRSGDQAESEGVEGLSVEQYATVQGDKTIVAQVDIKVPGHSRIQTRIALKDGQVAVLGEVGSGDSQTHYYVVSGAVRE